MKELSQNEIDNRKRLNLEWASCVSSEIYELFVSLSQNEWFMFIKDAGYSSKIIDFYVDNCACAFCLTYNKSDNNDLLEEEFNRKYVLWNRNECELPLSERDTIIVADDPQKISATISEYVYKYNDVTKYDTKNKIVFFLNNELFCENDPDFEYVKRVTLELDKIIIDVGIDRIDHDLSINIFRKCTKIVERIIELDTVHLDTDKLREITCFNYLCYDKCIKLNPNNYKLKKEYLQHLTEGNFPEWEKAIEIYNNLRKSGYLSKYDFDSSEWLEEMRDLRIMYYLPRNKQYIEYLASYGNIRNLINIDSYIKLRVLEDELTEIKPKLLILDKEVLETNSGWKLDDIKYIKSIVMSVEFRNVAKILYVNELISHDVNSDNYKKQRELVGEIKELGFDRVVYNDPYEKIHGLDIIRSIVAEKKAVET